MPISGNDVRKIEGGPYSKHVPALDGIRGLAVLGVIASHIFQGTPSTNVVIRAIQYIAGFGHNGVDIFFALSGFLITGILFDSLSDEHYFRNFYARRCLRIFPLYYGTLLVLLAITPLTHVQWHRQWLSLALYLQNTNWIDVAVPYFHAKAFDVNHFWSLAVEEQYYFFWPFLIFLIRDRKKLLWACLVLCIAATLFRFSLSLHHVPYYMSHCNTFARADALIAGGALALLLRGNHHDAVLRSTRWLVVVAPICLTIGSLLETKYALTDGVSFSVLETLTDTVLTLSSVGLIAWSIERSVANRFFASSLLRFFGKYSYGLYIFHLLIFSAIDSRIRGLVQHISHNKGFVVAATGLVILGISIVAAYLSYHLYEKKFLRLKHLFAYHKPPTPAVQTQSSVA